MPHRTRHPAAGTTVTVTPAAPLWNHSGTDPLLFTVDDWADRVWESSWTLMKGNLTALGYAVRFGVGRLPLDDDVVYGQDERGFSYLVHSTEITGTAPLVPQTAGGAR
jgi:hypothetical protein